MPVPPPLPTVEPVTPAAMWMFLLADVAAVLWAVRVLAREARRRLVHRRSGRGQQAPPGLELPEDFVLVLVPARRVGAHERRREPRFRLVG
jgi:hypothetical protein